MDDETTPEKKPKLRLAEGAEGRAICLEMQEKPFTQEEMRAQADRFYETSIFRTMTPEQEAKARGMGPEMVEPIRERREHRERGIKARRERGNA